MPSISPRKGVMIDDSALMGHLNDYALVLGKSLGEVVREQAGLFCIDMIRYTRPFKRPSGGFESDAKKAGLENVEKGVFKIFQPVSHAKPEEISKIGRYDVFKLWANDKKAGKLDSSPKAWKRFQSRYSNAPGAIIPYIDKGDNSAMQQVHFKHRRYNGKGGLNGYAVRAKKPFAYVKDEREIKRYIKEHQKHVGSFKSAYWFAAQKIRAKEVRAPAWLKHPRGSKFAIGVDKIQQAKTPEATVGNLIGLRQMPRGLVRAAISRRAYAMRFIMARELNKRKIPLWLATAQGKTVNTAKYF